jgi:hypothetical protein
VSRSSSRRSPGVGLRTVPVDVRLREIGTQSARTGHGFAGTVLGVGGGPTPRPWVGAETAPAGSGAARGGVD